MLPADVIAEIVANLAALSLQPSTATAVLGALAPLLRTTETPPPPALEPPHKSSRRPRVRRGSKRARDAPRRRYHRVAPSEARDRAIAAIKANPNANPTQIAKLAKVSRSTAANAARELASEARKAARRAARETSAPVTPRVPRERAQRFLREQLARGAKPASAVEDAAEKAHVGLTALEQARGDLGVVVSRANTGGVQAVQWSLPG